MPNVRERTTVGAPVDQAWSFLRDIENWAQLFPGCQGIEILDEHDSKWRVKGDVGILTKLVTFDCHVTKWVECEYVAFVLKCVEEPVTGTGEVTISRCEGGTGLELYLSFAATGLLGPVVNALLGKVLPKMTATFSAALKTEIESRLPTASSIDG